MIKVEIAYRGKGLASLKVKGHANTAEYGKDLVCSAVSACVVGAFNALDEEYEIEIEEGRAELIVPESMTDHDEVVIETLIIQLKTIEESYKGTIEIKERK